MRILVLSNLYPPNVIGGYERLCFEVTSGLAEAGHEMMVLTSRYGGKVASYPGQHVLRELDLLTGADIYTPFAGTEQDRAAINRQNLATLTRVLAEQKPDVVFAWNLFFLDVSLLHALEQSGMRTVVMLTDNWLLVMRNPIFVSDYFQNVVHGDQDMPFPNGQALSELRPVWKRVLKRLLQGSLRRIPAGKASWKRYSAPPSWAASTKPAAAVLPGTRSSITAFDKAAMPAGSRRIAVAWSVLERCACCLPAASST